MAFKSSNVNLMVLLNLGIQLIKKSIVYSENSYKANFKSLHFSSSEMNN